MGKNLYDLTGNVIAITGGNGLLGTSFAELLSKHGGDVVLLDTNVDGLDKKTEDLRRKYSTNPSSYRLDITKEQEIEEVTKMIKQKYGKLDTLINNAAFKPKDFFTPFECYPLKAWSEAVEVNLTAAMLCCKVFGNLMLRQKGGNIINIASIYGVRAPDQRMYEGTKINTPAVYSVTKAGLIHLTNYLASYWRGKNIRVNCISPGGVFAGQEAKFVKKYIAKVPLGRMANPEDIAGAVLFLSSEASRYITGHNLVVDGGFTI